MKINYCKKCHDAKRIKSLEKVVDELTNIVGHEVEVSTRCASFCGPGKKSFFVTIDDDIIEADNYDELITLVKEYSDEH